MAKAHDRNVYALRTALRAVLLILIVFAGWSMARSRPPSQWVTAEGWRQPIAGHALRFRVHVLSPADDDELLVVDLHWLGRHREPRGYLSGSAPQLLRRGMRAVEVQVPVPYRDELGYVFAVIYAGPSGSWQDRVRAAVSDAVPVRSEPDVPAESAMVRWTVHDDERIEAAPRSSSSVVRWITALVWFGAAVSCVWNGKRPATVRAPRDVRWFLDCAGACILAACWQLAAGDELTATVVRTLALHVSLYHEREAFQIAATLVALVIGSIVLVRIAETDEKPHGDRLLLLGLATFVVASVVDAISHHAIDRLAGALWLGLPAIAWIKIGAGGIAITGGASARRRAA